MIYSVHTSAPGKLILIGEHAVVYNRMALCGSVSSKQLHCWIDPREDGMIALHVSEDGGNSEEAVVLDSKQLIEADRSWITGELYHTDQMRDVESIDQRIASLPMVPASVSPLTKSGVMISLFYALQLVSEEDLLRGLTIRIENHGIPVQKGLGGSAALCVSVAAAILQCRHPSDCTRSFLEEVNAWAYKGEVLYHGKPSGIDNTVSCYGGLVVFCKKGDGQYEVRPLQTEPLSLVLVDTMLPKNTARMIEKVGTLRNTLPITTEHLFDTIEALVKEVVSEDDHFDGTHFYDAIQVNQGLLRILGVSCDAIEDVVETAARYRHAAKLTGGGGGGCVFAVSREPSQREELVRELQNRGYTTQIATIGGKGLVVYYLVCCCE